MLYHGAQRVKLPNLSKISRLLFPLAIFLRFQVFQRYMISDVVFWWKVGSNFGHFASTLLIQVGASTFSEIERHLTLSERGPTLAVRI